jgi:hypothetical protein
MTVGKQNPLRWVQSKAAEIKEALCFLRHGGFENSLRNISVLPQDIRTAFCLLCGEQELAVSASEASNAPMVRKI